MQNRPIPSDEWCVFTPMALSQYCNDFGLESDILRGTETDANMVYGQSVKDWSVIFRPFQLGYLFLSPARGLSFYWCAKLIALLLVSFDFGMLLTGRRCICSAGMAWLSCCYLLVLYPAWQVPFFYVFLSLGTAAATRYFR